MKRFLLILLTLGCLGTYANAQKSELYLVAGRGKLYNKLNKPTLSGNFGIRASPGSKSFYMNFGLGLYFITSEVPMGGESVYNTELAIGPGYRYQKGRMTFKIGADLGITVALNGYRNYLAAVPQASLTFSTRRKLDIGVLLKMSTPITKMAPDSHRQQFPYYTPKFWGAGLLFRI